MPYNSVLHLPNGNTTVVTHIGMVVITSQVILHNVICVPSFQYNLLSVSKLLNSTSMSVLFNKHVCPLQDPSLMNALEICKTENGLYILNTSSFHSTHSTILDVPSSLNTDLWHARTCHGPVALLHLFPFKCKSTLSHECHVCHLPKQVKNTFTSSVSCTSYVFDLVHMDL